MGQLISIIVLILGIILWHSKKCLKKSEIPLDQFIYKALYHPKKGYYMNNMPFGKDGDFITAPNISKIFSENGFFMVDIILGKIS